MKKCKTVSQPKEKVVENKSILVRVLCVVGSLKDIETIIKKNVVIGVAAGSLVVIRGLVKRLFILTRREKRII